MKPNTNLSIEKLCGQLIVGGFSQPELPAHFETALQTGERAGAILFRRNLPTVDHAHMLCRQLASAAGEAPPWIAVDQEGGRVARLGSPVVQLPPMRSLGALGDWSLIEQAGLLLGRQLGSVGFNLDFAPVLDVDSNPNNPVIGDRAFGDTPDVVIRSARAFARGLMQAGVCACGKHFPGHGDTALDSHVALPYVAHHWQRLNDVEVAPFRRLAAELPALMSAHVIFQALDGARPATLSQRILTGLLRDDLDFAGVVFSDDMEMGALASNWPIEESAVAAVRAGCDVLLICHTWGVQQRALEALITAAERDEGFLKRCREAASRSVGLRRQFPPRAAESPEAVEAPLRTKEARNLLSQLAPHLRQEGSY